jgi:hypothetical protein
MRRGIVQCFAALTLAATLAACKSAMPGSRTELLPPALPAGAGGFSDSEIQRARDLYVAKCAKCHKFYAPANYSAEDWNLWMVKMSKKAKLKPPQTELLTRYLDIFRQNKIQTLPKSPEPSAPKPAWPD